MAFRRSYQDDPTIEQLLGGDAGVPSSYAGVAAVLASSAAPSDADELDGAGVASARLAAIAAGTHRRPRLLLVPRRKIAILGMAALFVLTGALAAAGALPGPVQGVARDVVAKVGIHIPGPDAHAGNHPFERGKSGKTKEHTPGQRGGSDHSRNATPSPGPGNGNGKGQVRAPGVPIGH